MEQGLLELAQSSLARLRGESLLFTPAEFDEHFAVVAQAAPELGLDDDSLQALQISARKTAIRYWLKRLEERYGVVPEVLEYLREFLRRDGQTLAYVDVTPDGEARLLRDYYRDELNQGLQFVRELLALLQQSSFPVRAYGKERVFSSRLRDLLGNSPKSLSGFLAAMKVSYSVTCPYEQMAMTLAWMESLLPKVQYTPEMERRFRGDLQRFREKLPAPVAEAR